ncbi:hypothetical protein X756_31435 [Mesorhizobium sp. LSHC412B00]|nr:hypothetical protein X756_31435 [Mesorhizobium sp. LSHC412B00]
MGGLAAEDILCGKAKVDAFAGIALALPVQSLMLSKLLEQDLASRFGQASRTGRTVWCCAMTTRTRGRYSRNDSLTDARRMNFWHVRGSGACTGLLAELSFAYQIGIGPQAKTLIYK